MEIDESEFECRRHEIVGELRSSNSQHCRTSDELLLAVQKP